MLGEATKKGETMKAHGLSNWKHDAELAVSADGLVTNAPTVGRAPGTMLKA